MTLSSIRASGAFTPSFDEIKKAAAPTKAILSGETSGASQVDRTAFRSLGSLTRVNHKPLPKPRADAVDEAATKAALAAERTERATSLWAARGRAGGPSGIHDPADPPTIPLILQSNSRELATGEKETDLKGATVSSPRTGIAKEDVGAPSGPFRDVSYWLDQTLLTADSKTLDVEG